MRSEEQIQAASRRIIVALDVDSVAQAMVLVEMLTGKVGKFKIGLQLIFTILVELLTPMSLTEAFDNLDRARKLFRLLHGQIMLDVKLKDIPPTIAGASGAIARLGVDLFTVHASAGTRGLREAVKNRGTSSVIAVTVLTSMDEDECQSIYGENVADKVRAFTRLAVEAKVQYLVCAPHDLELLKDIPGADEIEKICPNITPVWAAVPKDQNKNRSMTPFEAMQAGAAYLVIGRAITKPPPEIGSPKDAARKIAEEIASFFP
ncbi:MAG: orotidine-5'-phosphate decarboxylase [Patescibacteria group bacterium]|jgi:orotidine-5'-phosphate decarboxylase